MSITSSRWLLEGQRVQAKRIVFNYNVENILVKKSIDYLIQKAEKFTGEK